MLTYTLDHKGNESLYEYLYRCIKEDILSGVLAPHEKLPSKRTFAGNLGVSVLTVENTYGQLMAEGYIYSKAKSGFFVSPIESRIDKRVEKTDLVTEKKIDEKKKTINLIRNHTSKENFPFSVWSKIMRSILTQQDDLLLTSPPMGGVYELRQAIAKHLQEFRGISCRPEQIMIGAGTEYLYGLIVQLLGRDKIYGLENPSSKKIKNIYEALGVKVTPLSMDEEGIHLSTENLTLPDIIQISPSHQFPLGIVTTASRRYGLLQWANEKEDRYIIEDDYDSEFRLQGRPIPSLFSMDATDKVIYFNTFTKSLSSTIRISYMVLPDPLLEQFEHKLGFYSCTVSNFEQYALAEFIAETHFEKHINRMRNFYRTLRDDLLNDLFKGKLKDRIEILEENSGIHFLLKIATDESDEALKRKALAEGVQLSFVSDYCSYDFKNTKDKYEHLAIINYSGLSKEEAGEVAGALERAWIADEK